ncbi:M23 family metallopeptidase [Oceanospirillum maris]|uniref:M23 family metallopeptidase n=1 Tax=Oceanospirillum maris TaxID=64977 RepID=UPI000483D742|nr:M23 family metallopeptidase [Oceanospirillum maris]
MPKLLVHIILLIGSLLLSACSSSPYGPATSKVHLVRLGETFYSIARRYDVDLETLARYNPKVVPHRLKAGTELQIPARGVVAQKPSIQYTVQRGDTLSSISDHFATPLGDLKQSNPGIDHDRLFPGQNLIIAVGTRRAATGYIWPISSPQLISGFGEENWGLQKGVNLRAKQGQTVFAAKGGSISFAGEMRSLGKVIIIQHPNDQQTVYASCEALVVKTGDRVKKQQPIATVGFNTLVNEAALHFQFRDRGAPLPPENYLPIIE